MARRALPRDPHQDADRCGVDASACDRRRNRAHGDGAMVSAPAAPAPHRRACAANPADWAIGRAATLALYDELALSPKPGLVTLTDRGSHDDMDARTFMRSLIA